MLTKTGIALALILTVGAGSAAQAQVQHRKAPQHRAVDRSFQSRDVALPRELAPSPEEERWMDRASEHSGGGY